MVSNESVPQHIPRASMVESPSSVISPPEVNVLPVTYIMSSVLTMGFAGVVKHKTLP